MRRKDKEIASFKEIESIVKKAIVCRIGLSLNNIPYVVPVNFGYEDRCLYFHSASEGKKIDIIKQNNNLCFEVDTDLSLIKSSGNPCTGTMKYDSVIGFGKAYFINDPEKKREALNIIVRHYLPGTSFDFSDESFNKIVVIKMEISSMTGKRSGH